MLRTAARIAVAPVDHEQPRLLDVQPALDQVAEQGVAGPFVLRGALPQSEGMFATIAIDASATTMQEVSAISTPSADRRRSRASEPSRMPNCDGN